MQTTTRENCQFFLRSIIFLTVIYWVYKESIKNIKSNLANHRMNHVFSCCGLQDAHVFLRCTETTPTLYINDIFKINTKFRFAMLNMFYTRWSLLQFVWQFYEYFRISRPCDFLSAPRRLNFLTAAGLPRYSVSTWVSVLGELSRSFEKKKMICFFRINVKMHTKFPHLVNPVLYYSAARMSLYYINVEFTNYVGKGDILIACRDP